jgi:hypothetical protein
MQANYSRVFESSTSEIDSEASDMQIIKNKLSKTSSRLKTHPKIEKPVSADSIKCFFIYYPETEMPDLSAFNNHHIGIYVEKDYFFPQNNRNLTLKKLWGTEFYHYKSDIVLMLFHSGRVNIEILKNEKIKGFTLICQVSKRKNFKESVMNGVTSQKLSGQDKDGFTLKPIQLQPLESFKARNLLFHADRLQFISKRRVKGIPRYISPHNAVSLYCCKFNKLNDLSIQYTLQNICDKSDKREEFLSCMLEEYDLVIESINGNKILLQLKSVSKDIGSNNQILYQLSEVLNPLGTDRQVLQNALTGDGPKPLKLLIDDLKWEEIFWDKDQITVRDMVFQGLDNMIFMIKSHLKINLESEKE